MSHDRYFINRTATRILDLTDGSFINYIGNYDYYLEKKEDVEAAFAAGQMAQTANNHPAGANGTQAQSVSAVSGVSSAFFPGTYDRLRCRLSLLTEKWTGKPRKRSRPVFANARMN